MCTNAHTRNAATVCPDLYFIKLSITHVLFTQYLLTYWRVHRRRYSVNQHNTSEGNVLDKRGTILGKDNSRGTFYANEENQSITCVPLVHFTFGSIWRIYHLQLIICMTSLTGWVVWYMIDSCWVPPSVERRLIWGVILHCSCGMWVSMDLMVQQLFLFIHGK